MAYLKKYSGNKYTLAKANQGLPY